jgi:hypothetical protein
VSIEEHKRKSIDSIFVQMVIYIKAFVDKNSNQDRDIQENKLSNI